MNRADRNIIYSFIQQALDDAKRHLDHASAFASNNTDTEAAVGRCLRARDAIREARGEIVVSSELVTRRKQTIFEREIAELDKRLWCLTKEISRLTKVCHSEHRKSSVLRIHFLAYNYKHQDGAEAIGG